MFLTEFDIIYFYDNIKLEDYNLCFNDGTDIKFEHVDHMNDNKYLLGESFYRQTKSFLEYHPFDSGHKTFLLIKHGIHSKLVPYSLWKTNIEKSTFYFIEIPKIHVSNDITHIGQTRIDVLPIIQNDNVLYYLLAACDSVSKSILNCASINHLKAININSWIRCKNY